MARDVTVTFGDGSSHVYRNAPDDIAPGDVQARAEKDFGKSVTALDGGRKAATPAQAPAAPVATNPAPDSGVMGGDDMWAPIVAAQGKKPKSVLEGVTLPDLGVDAELNRQTMLRSGSPDSVMFNPGRGKAEADRLVAIGAAKEAKAKAERENLRAKAKEEDYSFTDFAKDTGLDLSKGGNQLLESYVGLLDLTTGGAAGRVLSQEGYDSQKVNKFLTGFQSLTRKNADADVEEAEGFLNTLKSMAINPTALLGTVVQSLPGTVVSGLAGGRYVRFLVGKATNEAASLGLTGAKAQSFIIQKVKEQSAKIAAVTSGTEGIQTAGSTAEAGRQAEKDWNEYVLPSLAAGFGTTAIGAGSGKVAQKLGIGDIETNIAARSAGVKGVGVGEGAFLTRFLTEAGKEGLLEEMPQSYQEKIFQNLATGRPWDEGVDEAAARGLVAGIGMAGGHSAGVEALKKGSSAAKAILPQQRDGYAKDTSYEGLSSLIAQSKGFLTPEAKAQETTKPTKTTANVASPEVEEVAPEASIADRDTRIKELAERIAKTTGATEGDSLRVATQRIEREEAQNEQPTTRADAEGSNALGEPIGGADRAGVSVAEQPEEVSTTQGTEGAQPGAVVPAGSATDGTAVGAGQQPNTLTRGSVTPDAVRALSDEQLNTELTNISLSDAEYKLVKTELTQRQQATVDPDSKEAYAQRTQGEKAAPTWEDVDARVNRVADRYEQAGMPDKAAQVRESLNQQRPTYTGTAELETQQDQELNPPETKGTTTDGNETPETVEAETQGQETSAAAAEVNKPKRGRPAKVLSAEEQAAAAVKATQQRGRPSLTLTPEQVATRDKERKDKRAVYMKVGRAIDKLAPKLNSAILGGERDTKRKLLKQILELEPSVRGTPVGAKIKAALANPRITPEEIASVKREIAEEQGKLLPSVSDSSSPSDSKFNNFTNGVQALGHIIKTGNPFQQMLGKRLRGFVNGVKFVVLETDSLVPKSLQGSNSDQWTTAHAIYVPREKAIYVKGKSFGKMRGTSNSTILHELLHAATSMKLRLGQRALDIGYDQNNAVTQVTKDLLMVMNNAKQRFDEMKAAGTLPEHIEKIGKAGGGFSNIEEFLAYGMSDKAMQEFLMGTKGIGTTKSFFSRFVHDIARLFNIGAKDENALLDLIAGTDRLLTARKSASMRYVEAEANRKFGEQKLSAANVTEEEDGEGEVDGEEAPTPDTVIDKAKEAADKQNKKVAGALKTVAMSRNGNELGKAVSALAALRSPSTVWNELKYFWNDLSDGARTTISHAYDSDAIANSGVGDAIPALRDANKIFHHMTAMTGSLLRGTADQSESLVRFFRARPDQMDNFADLVSTSTLAHYDPSNTKNKIRDVTLDNLYSGLGEQGQVAYKNLRDYYSAMNDLQASIITEQLDNLDIPDAERTKLIKGIREVYEAANKIQPYFPLMRHGDFVLEYGKGVNRVSVRFDTKAQQRRAVDAYAKSKGKTAQQAKKDGDFKTYEDAGGVKLRNYVEANSILLKTIYSAVDAAPLADSTVDQTKVRNDIKDQVYQAYLVAMPEQSVRKMFMHRQGTAGFSNDVLRDLNAYGSRAAKYYSKLKYGTDIRNALEAAERGLVGNEKYKPFVDRMTEMVAAYLQPAQQTGIEQVATTAADIVTKVSFIRNLTSWSSAMLQPMDIIMKGGPILSGNHGATGIAELSKAMKLWDTMGTVQHNADGTTSWRAPSIEFAEGLSPEQRRAVQQMVSLYGVTNDTLANEVYNRARVPATKVDSKWLEVTKDVGNNAIMGGLMHHGERISREVVWFASYNSFRREGVPLDEAVYKAVMETNEVLGNYSPNVRPMFMRGAGGRLLTMYKFYPLVTTRQLVGNFFRMLPMFNKEGKAAAATKFFGIMGTHLLLGGVRSLPLFSVVMGMLGAAWKEWGKDPDAPDEMKDVDYETWWLTEYIPSMLGDTKLGDLTQLAENGVLNAVTGWDIASRISLNDMWFREPTPGKTLKESMMNWGWVAGGAAATTTLDIATGVSLLYNGDYEKGFEKLLPGSISKLLMADRFANQGVEDSRGAELVAPGKLSKSELAGQALGFRPAKVSAAQTAAFKATAANTAIINEKRNLSNQLVDNFRKSNNLKESDAYQERFGEKFDKTLEKIEDYSKRNPEQAFTGDEIKSLLGTAMKKKALTEAGAGIALNKDNARLLGAASEFTEKTLSEYNDRK